MINYAEGHYELERNLVDTIPLDVLKYIYDFYVLFHHKYQEDTRVYRMTIIPEKKPNYHPYLLDTIHMFRRTRRTYKIYHPLTNFRKVKPCELCGRIPVGRVYSTWDERLGDHRPWGKRNKKTGKLQRCGIRKKICFECSVRYCCSYPGCSKTHKDKKIPPKGMEKCLNCLAKFLDIND